MKRIYPILTACVLLFSQNIFAQSDFCASATPITVTTGSCSSVTFDNLTATTSAGDPVPACWSPATISNNVWFTFNPPGTAVHLSTTFNGFTLGNTQIAVYSGTCGALTQLACQEDLLPGSNNNNDIIVSGLTAGNTYYIMIDGNGSQTGTFGLCVEDIPAPAPPSPNNDCPTGTLICDLSSVTVGNGPGNDGALEEVPSCFGDERSSNWYTFTAATGGNLSFLITPSTAIDYDYAVFDVTSGCLGTQVACNYCGCTNNGGLTGLGAGCSNSCGGLTPCNACGPSISITAGNTYAILVDRYTASSTSGYTLSFAGSNFTIAPPSLDFTANTVCQGAATQFTNLTPGNGNIYSWDFGDGFTSSATNPTHTYALAGTYTVSLLVTTQPEGCQNTISKSVTVTSAANVTITPSSATMCQGDSVDLSTTAVLNTPNYSQTFSQGTDLTIPNNTTVNSPLVVGPSVSPATLGAGVIQAVCMNISHQNNADLDISLIAPNGSSMVLSTDKGGTGNNYTNVCFVPSGGAALPTTNTNISGNFAPQGSFASLTGNTNGTWNLNITDDAGAPAGTLTDWYITFNLTNTIASYVWSPTTNLAPTTGAVVEAKPTVSRTYSVTVTDQLGCQATKSVPITVNPKPTMTSAGTTTICSGNTIGLSFTSSIASTYSWVAADNPNTTGESTGAVTNPTINDIVTNNTNAVQTVVYTVTPKSNVGNCTGPAQTVNVTVNPKPTAAISGTATICPGSSATISIALTGIAPWSVTYTKDGASPITVTNILTSPYTFTTGVAGTYAVSAVSDANCTGTFSGSAVVSINPAIVVSNIITTCGGGNYTVSFDISGGTPPYTVTGGGGTLAGNTFTSNSIASGVNYAFDVNDSKNCASQKVDVDGVKNCGCPLTGVVSGGGTVCAGTSAPNIVFTLRFGTSSPYTLTYAINGVPQTAVAVAAGFPNSSYTIASPGAGTYTIVSIKDASCTGSGSGSATVTINPKPTSTVSGGGTVCSGSTSNVNIALTGTGPWNITYAINGVNQPPVTGVNTTPYVIAASAPGNYTVTALNDANCTGTVFSGSADVTINPIPVVTNNPLNKTICSGDNTGISLTSDVVGSTFNYTAVLSSGTVSGFTASALGVTSIGDVLSNISGNSGSVTYSITPVGPAPTFCQGIPVDYIATVDPIPSVTNSTLTQVLCNGGNASFTPTSDVTGALFSWTAASVNGTTTGFTAQNPGTSISEILTNSSNVPDTVKYVITPKFGNCTGTPVTFSVAVDPIPSVNSVPDITPCSDESVAAINFTGTVPGATYTWTNSNTSIGLAANSGGNVTGIPAFIAPTNLSGVNITGTITITPTFNGCVGPDSTFDITILPAPQLNALSDITVCPGQPIGPVNLTSTPAGASFDWVNDNTNIGIPASGVTNQLKWTNDISPNNITGIDIVGTITVSLGLNGCSGPDSTIVVTIRPTPTFTVSKTDPTTCGGTGSITISSLDPNTNYNVFYTTPGPIVTGPLAMTSDGAGAITLTGLAQDSYSNITVESAAGCRGVAVGTQVLFFNGVPASPSVVSPVTYCQNAAATDLSGNATGTALLWYATPTGGTGSSTAPTPSTSVPGTFTFYVTQTTSNCESPRDSIKVIVNALPAAPAVTTPVTYCQGATPVDLSSNATGTGLLWYTVSTGGAGSGAAPTPNTSSVGSTLYYVSQTISNCEGPRASVQVDVTLTPAAPAPAANTPCEGSALNLTTAAVPGATGYSWTGPNGFTSTSQNPNINSSTTAATGTYSVVAIAGACTGAVAQVNATVNAIPVPTPHITPSSGTSPLTVVFTNSNNNPSSIYTYSWDFGNGSVSSTASNTIVYTAGVYNGLYTVVENGCPASQSFSITVEGTFIIPNVFSPNGDGVNDEFKATGDGIATYSCEIFDRWGIKMFSTQEVGKGWTGTNKGSNDAPEGTYFYIIKISTFGGETIDKSDHVTLVR